MVLRPSSCRIQVAPLDDSQLATKESEAMATENGRCGQGVIGPLFLAVAGSEVLGKCGCEGACTSRRLGLIAPLAFPMSTVILLVI